MKQFFILGAVMLGISAHGQLVVQSGATFFIDAGATVTVQGDLTSNASITGPGKVLMKGTAAQNLNMNGFNIPNLEIDNANNVTLTGQVQVMNNLSFTTGKVQLGNFNLTLDTNATVTGAGAGKFIETNGSGIVRKELSTAGTYVLPVGNGSDYTPVSINITGGTFTNAVVGAKSNSGGHPARHPRSTDYLNNYWSLSRSGITGTVSAVGTYVDPSDVTGTEADLRTMTYNGTMWSLGTSQDNTANTVTAPMSGNSADLYAMNRFVLVSPQVFLHGPFDQGTVLMRDRLRNSTGTYTPGTLPASNIIPSNDPYRTAPYNNFFSHTNNTVGESVTSSSVFNDQANAAFNIVDWIFVELRNVTSATTAPVIQTRSALLRRDGVVVDIDGVSPVYFKNVDAGSNYAISLKHRNHLAIGSNPASPLTLGLSGTSFDFTNTSNNSNIYGTPNTHFVQLASKNVLWGGNPRNGASANWSGLNNDKDYIYITVLGSNSGGSVSGYSAGDLNLDRTAKWSGLSNDKDFLYISVLGSSSSGTKSQSLPGN